MSDTATEMGETAEQGARRGGRRATGGAAARRAARSGGKTGPAMPYITRRVPVYEVLGEEALATIEANADTVLEEVGIEFRDDEEAIRLWKDAGADVKGQRVHFPKGLCRELLKTAPPSSPSMRAIPSAACRSAATPPYSRPSTARPSCATSMAAALRDDRGFPQFREARLYGAGPAPFRRHRVRTGRHPGQQAPSRHGLQPYALFGQTVHGVGHRAGAPAEDTVAMAGSCSATSSSTTTASSST
jgi:hypothetical protein